jgi:hypothetical protein
LKPSKIEPILLLLFAGMIFFTGCLFICEKFYHDDGQFFQVIAAMVTGFGSAFFMRTKPQTGEKGEKGESGEDGADSIKLAEKETTITIPNKEIAATIPSKETEGDLKK